MNEIKKAEIKRIKISPKREQNRIKGSLKNEGHEK